MMIWLLLGFVGWILLMRVRSVSDNLPTLSRSTLPGYIKGFLLALILGPISICFFIYLVWRLIND